jgi:uncharacterized damage-inducible protein DinB
MDAKEMLSYWKDSRQGLIDALELFSDDELHFRPHEGLWSLGETARHIADVEEGWIGYVARRLYPEWPPEPTHADAPTIEAVQVLLTETHARTVAYLQPLSEADLEQEIITPWEVHHPLRWIFWHVLEHEIHHRGEIYLMLGMLGREAPDV